MTTEQQLHEAVESMTGGEVVTPDLRAIVDRVTPRPRRIGFRVALVATSAAFVAAGGWLLTSPREESAPRTSATTPAHDHSYDIAGVKRASFGGGLDVTIRPGRPHMTLEARDDVMPDVHVTVRDGRLSVQRRSPPSRATDDVKVTVFGVQIEKLSAAGGVAIFTERMVFAANVTADLSGGVEWSGEIEATQGTIHASGGVDVRLAGRLSELVLTGDGGVRLDTRDVSARTVSVQIEGGASANVTATMRIVRALAHGGATILYGGVDHPDVTDADVSSSVRHR